MGRIRVVLSVVILGLEHASFLEEPSVIVLYIKSEKYCWLCSTCCHTVLGLDHVSYLEQPSVITLILRQRNRAAA